MEQVARVSLLSIAQGGVKEDGSDLSTASAISVLSLSAGNGNRTCRLPNLLFRVAASYEMPREYDS